MELKVYWVDNEDIDKDEVRSILSKRVEVGDQSSDFYSYVSKCTEMSIGNDGRLYLSDRDGDSYIYIYPDQLDHIKMMVDIAIAVRDGKSF